MAFIEKFLGKRVEIPEDRSYHVKQGLWAKSDNQEIVFGLTEPTLVLIGGVNDIDWLVQEGKTVAEREDVVFAITGKIMYLHTPVNGAIHFNPEIKQDTSVVGSNPYDKGWLFKIQPNTDLESTIRSFADAHEYIESLKGSEGCKNPEGLKGGVSGICKAVYSGIREQKI
jgi:glycine cleavage system H lipoate-binding protein